MDRKAVFWMLKWKFICMGTVLKLYIARRRQMGRSLSCELKGKPSQQDIPDSGAVLNDMDRTVDVRYM